MESRRSSRPKKQVDYTLSAEADPLFPTKPKLNDMADDFDDFRLEGTERRKIVDSLNKENLDNGHREPKRARLSATERKEQADLKKALELSLVEESCIDTGKVERTLIEDIWADPNFFSNHVSTTSQRKERHRSKNGTASDTALSDKQKTVSQEKHRSSSNPSSQSACQSNLVAVDLSPVKVNEATLESRKFKQVPSPKEIEDLFDDGDLSDSMAIDVISDDEVTLVPDGKRKVKLHSSASNQDTLYSFKEHDAKQVGEAETTQRLFLPGNKESPVIAPSAMSEVNIVISKMSPNNKDVNVVEDSDNNITKRRSPRSARKKENDSIKSGEVSDSEFEHPKAALNSKRKSRVIFNQAYDSDNEDESESEFEETISKSKRKMKTPFKPKSKKSTTSKTSKTETLDEINIDAGFQHPDLDQASEDEDSKGCTNTEREVDNHLSPKKSPKIAQTPKSRAAAQINIIPNNTTNRTPSVGLKASNSLKPLLLTKPTVPVNDISPLNSRGSITPGGPARVGLSRRHKYKPLHPYLQSPSKIPQT